MLAAVDASLDESWAATLARHLGHGLPPAEADLRVGRRYAVARRLAGLFASYAVQRPGLVADWSAGRDTDGAGEPLDGDLLWQPELWRRLAVAVPAEAPHVRHAATLARLRDDPGAVDLPARVSLFGHTRLPVTEIELLAALGEHRDVHLWLPHPSDALWAALAGEAREGPVERRGDPSHQRVGHRLLATLGRDTRELQRALTAVAPVDESLPLPEPGPDSLLGGCRPTSAPTPPDRRPPGPCGPTTVPCRCTPATARPARSRCCARCCSACSPTTPRSSPATCW